MRTSLNDGNKNTSVELLLLLKPVPAVSSNRSIFLSARLHRSTQRLRVAGHIRRMFRKRSPTYSVRPKRSIFELRNFPI